MINKEKLAKIACNSGKLITRPEIISFLFFSIVYIFGEPIWFAVSLGLIAGVVSYFLWGGDFDFLE